MGFVMFFIAGCRNENSKIHSADKTVEKKNAKIETPEYLEGKKYFNQYCMACHMQETARQTLKLEGWWGQ